MLNYKDENQEKDDNNNEDFNLLVNEENQELGS